MLQRLKYGWPTLASVALYSLAFPPTNLGFLILVALVPWLNHLRKMNPKQAFWSGLAFGMMFYLFQMFWIVPFVGRWTSVGMALIPWALCPLIGGWYFAVVGWLLQRCFAKNVAWLIPLVWAGVEAGRSYFPLLAFPWGLAATPLWFIPQLIQSAALGTIFMVSAWVVLVNVTIANLLVRTVDPKPGKKGPKMERVTGRMVFVAASLLVLSVFRYSQGAPGEIVRVGVGQPGVDLAFQSRDKQEQGLEQEVPWLAEQAVEKECRFLVLPEGLTFGGDSLPPRTPFLGNPPLPTLIGGQRGRSPSYQSAYAYSDGKWSFADKTRLVIFGEFVPFREYLPFLSGFRLPTGDLKEGDWVRAVELGGIKVGPLVCFEALFPNIAQAQTDNGSRLLAVMSNDDWYMDSNAPEQLKAASIFRAVESGLPLVRAASNGYTLAVDSRGRVLGQVPVKTTRLLVSEVPIPASSDAFRFRWVFPWLCAAVIVFVLVWRRDL